MQVFTLSLLNSEELLKFKTEGIQCQQCLDGRQRRNPIPEEKLFPSTKPQLSYLKVLGCLSHMHIGQCSRNKLQSYSSIGSFVDYDEQTKEYCIYLH
uniref:GAG-pre-integrase domain-containing protein n=1 Tax=Physcomitrium patens TaxID=3218 RepID=A0A7I4ATT1_PHYPA